MESILTELQQIIIIAAGAAVTALCAAAMASLRRYLGIVESDSNEEAVRRAALTEAGKLILQGKIDDPLRIDESAAKVIADLHAQVKDEGYNSLDIKDMIIGAAATVFPPANFLKLLK